MKTEKAVKGELKQPKKHQVGVLLEIGNISVEKKATRKITRRGTRRQGTNSDGPPVLPEIDATSDAQPTQQEPAPVAEQPPQSPQKEKVSLPLAVPQTLPSVPAVPALSPTTPRSKKRTKHREDSTKDSPSSPKSVHGEPTRVDEAPAASLQSEVEPYPASETPATKEAKVPQTDETLVEATPAPVEQQKEEPVSEEKPEPIQPTEPQPEPKPEPEPEPEHGPKPVEEVAAPEITAPKPAETTEEKIKAPEPATETAPESPKPEQPLPQTELEVPLVVSSTEEAKEVAPVAQVVSAPSQETKLAFQKFRTTTGATQDSKITIKTNVPKASLTSPKNTVSSRPPVNNDAKPFSSAASFRQRLLLFQQIENANAEAQEKDKNVARLVSKEKVKAPEVHVNQEEKSISEEDEEDSDEGR